MIVNLVLWAAGAALIVGGIYMVQRPWNRYQAMRRIDDNSSRYDAWRGGSRRTAVDPGPSGRSGADLMKQQLRQRVFMWSGAIVVGVVLVVVGFAVR